MKQNNDYETLIAYVLEKSNNFQMTEEEYRYISSFLGDKNFLVFGTGHDTPLWRYSNRQGHTLFLENDSRWIDKNDSDVILVNYSTKCSQYKVLLEEYHNDNFENLKMDLPNEVTNTKWDCIFVDSPVGTKDNKPGRMQSIFTASMLAHKDTDVFVHDTDREVEDLYSTTMFNQTIRQLTKLRHLRK